MPILLTIQEVGFWIYALIVFILVLGTIIILHEGGHFFFARKAGILCHEFSAGMGPLIKQKKKGETAYSVRAIPVGGYVAMAGEDTNENLLKEEQEIGLNFKTATENSLLKQPVLKKGEEKPEDTSAEVEVVSEIVITDKVEATIKGKVVAYDLYSKDGDAMWIEIALEDGTTNKYFVARDALYVMSKKEKVQLAPYDRCFESKTKWQRFLTVFGGPFMNFVLAFFIFVIVGLGTGVSDTNSTKIGSLTETYPASEVLQVGDEITAINGDSITKWNDISTVMKKYNGNTSVEVTYNRDGVSHTDTVNTVVVSYRLGIANYSTIGEVPTDGIVVSLIYSKDYVISKAGVTEGDKLTAYYVGANKVAITSWKQLLDYLDENPNLSSLEIEYYDLKEDGTYAAEATTVKTDVWTESSLDTLNVGVSSRTTIGITCSNHFSFFGGLGNACVMFWNSITTVFKTLGALFSNSQIGITDLSGPVGIFQAVKSYLNTDFLTFLSFVGLISANIGLVNLLPIPALDGGRILFIIIEAITKKKINKKFETLLNNIVFWLIMALFVFITFNDILRIFK